MEPLLKYFLVFLNLLFIEGCVNTLKEECTEFYENHGHDGRNNSANSRYPCYYTPDNSGKQGLIMVDSNLV